MFDFRRYALRLFTENQSVDSKIPMITPGGDVLEEPINLERFGQKPWQEAYRAFEFLQQLPYGPAASCSCESVIGDGTLELCIKASVLHLQPLPFRQAIREPVPFQNHVFLKHVDSRELLREYALLCLWTDLLTALYFCQVLPHWSG